MNEGRFVLQMMVKGFEPPPFLLPGIKPDEAMGDALGLYLFSKRFIAKKPGLESLFFTGGHLQKEVLVDDPDLIQFTAHRLVFISVRTFSRHLCFCTVALRRPLKPNFSAMSCMEELS